MNDCFQWMHLNHGDEGLKRAFRRMYHQVTVAALPCSVADPGCLYGIPDPTFFQPGSRIRIFSIPDPQQRINPKKWFLSSRKYDPGCISRIRILTFYLSRNSDPGSRGQKGTEFRTRNTAPLACGLRTNWILTLKIKDIYYVTLVY